MRSVCLSIRLCFVKLPQTREPRIFRDRMLLRDAEEKSYQDLSDLIEKKLSFMEIPPSDFTVLYREDGGDRVVVDHAYFFELSQRWCRLADLSPSVPLHEGQLLETDDLSDSEGTTSIDVSFDIEVNNIRCGGNPSGSAAAVTPTCAPLTAANLAALANQPSPAATVAAPLPPTRSAGQWVGIGALSCPPQTNFFLHCVLIDIRFKNPKPDLTVTELELVDAKDPKQQITAVTFDPGVQKEVKVSLRPDGRQVLEIRNVYVRRKTELDQRYATNQHPLLLRIDRGSKLEVVQVLPVPVHSNTVALPSAGGTATCPRPCMTTGGVITVRQTMRSGGIVDLSDLTGIRARGGTGSGVDPTYLLSSSSSSGPRRTTFSFTSATASTAIAGVVPSSHGQYLRAQQAAFVNRPTAEQDIPVEPGLITVTARDVRAREDTVYQHASNQETRKERIRRRVETSASCLLCGLDCDDVEATTRVVRRLLEASTRNRGACIPTVEQLRNDLSDRRPSVPGGRPTRLVTQATFVNMTTRTVHPLHCRCAHLCTSYQNGKDLEDIAWIDLHMQMCSLCGMSGACVSCYHPDCNEMYHVVCALYSGGYVNFGKRDPYLPCPACPRHTQVLISRKRREETVIHVDESCWQDDIAFDSRVVSATDLRDPDENGGE